MGPPIHIKMIDDSNCRNEILNHLDNLLCGVFPKYKITKELWEALKKEYATKDVEIKKIEIEELLDFQMEEGKSMMAQVRDFQEIIHEGMKEWIYTNNLYLAVRSQTGTKLKRNLGSL